MSSFFHGKPARPRVVALGGRSQRSQANQAQQARQARLQRQEERRKQHAAQTILNALHVAAARSHAQRLAVNELTQVLRSAQLAHTPPSDATFHRIAMLIHWSSIRRPCWSFQHPELLSAAATVCANNSSAWCSCMLACSSRTSRASSPGLQIRRQAQLLARFVQHAHHLEACRQALLAVDSLELDQLEPIVTAFATDVELDLLERLIAVGAKHLAVRLISLLKGERLGHVFQQALCSPSYQRLAPLFDLERAGKAMAELDANSVPMNVRVKSCQRLLDVARLQRAPLPPSQVRLLGSLVGDAWVDVLYFPQTNVSSQHDDDEEENDSDVEMETAEQDSQESRVLKSQPRQLGGTILDENVLIQLRAQVLEDVLSIEDFAVLVAPSLALVDTTQRTMALTKLAFADGYMLIHRLASALANDREAAATTALFSYILSHLMAALDQEELVKLMDGPIAAVCQRILEKETNLILQGNATKVVGPTLPALRQLFSRLHDSPASSKMTFVLTATNTIDVVAAMRSETLETFLRDIVDVVQDNSNTGRVLILLRELPFTVPFLKRASVFQTLTATFHSGAGERPVLFMDRGRMATVRRAHMYEDTFEAWGQPQSSLQNARPQVQIINQDGLPEAGIDGGGLFREALVESIKLGFDPDHGLFKVATDNTLCPNPDSAIHYPDHSKHFVFLGRLLGRVLRDGMLVDLPLARFFLAQLLGLRATFDDLRFLDAELHKQLSFIKDYEGDVSELDLTFSVTGSAVTGHETIDLIPAGRDIAVTSQNRVQYVMRLADYYLNRQTASQVAAFRHGLSDIINLELLSLFAPNELQLLISGSQSEIDVADWQANTVLAGFTEGQGMMQFFWQVVGQLDERQKRLLLKFVTSCPRPPLLGFRALVPKFAIKNAGEDETRLPTSSTCMNLLKLPNYKDAETLRKQLIYAIESNAGFELS